MKFLSYATLAAALLALGGCASLGPTDASSIQAGLAAPNEPVATPPAPPSLAPQYPDGALTPIAEHEAAPRTVTALTAPADLWERIRRGFAMPDLQSELVPGREQWYAARPEELENMAERSRKYLFHIVEELERRNLPTELALLPFIESAYNPQAYSRARAAGMWQFIPSTGRLYQLKQNAFRDDRRDVLASTRAALDYLERLHGMFGDWHLALASYNWGEGAVARAIAKNQAKGLPTDYLSLSMPEETRYYVPKLQAIKNIIAQPEVYGLKLDPMPNRPYFGTVDKPGDMDIALAAKLAETPLDEFIALNPAYQRPVMPGASKSPIVLPAEKVQTFLDNLDAHEQQDKPLSAWKTYTLKKGDKLDAVASRYDISTAYLKQLNGISARTKVGPGMTLLVPGKDAPQPAQFAALDAKLPNPPSDKAKTCTARKKGKTVTVPCPTAAKPAAKGKTASKPPAKTVSKGAKTSTKAKAAPAAKHAKPAAKTPQTKKK